MGEALIDPRHEVPPPHGEAVWPHIPDPLKRERAQMAFGFKIIATGFLFAGLACALMLALIATGRAADLSGQWKASPLKSWFDKLASGKGLCCSFADGFKIEDVDWDTQGGHYRVRLNGNWIVVPDAALVTEPNKFGQAVVWPYQDASGVTQIRCFIPGSGA